jgi:hypothetical protein
MLVNGKDEKTQEWLLRTQEIRRRPALRGGVQPDYRTRRDTALSLVMVVFSLSMLVMFSPRLLHPLNREASEEAPRRLLANHPMVKVFTGPFRPFPIQAMPYTEEVVLSESQGYFVGAVFRPAALLPPPGHVAPSAPVWLDRSASLAAGRISLLPASSGLP